MSQTADDAAFLQAVGRRVRPLRARRGMTRRILAHHSGVSERYISAVEAGNGNGSILLLRSLVAALHVDLRALLEPEATSPGCPTTTAGLPCSVCAAPASPPSAVCWPTSWCAVGGTGSGD